MRRHFTLMEALCVMAIGAILLSSTMAATARLIRFQRQQLALAWSVQEEALIADQWRRYVATLPESKPAVTAYVKDDKLIMGEWQRPLPAGTTAQFAESADLPELQILELVHGTTGERLRFVGRRQGAVR